MPFTKVKTTVNESDRLGLFSSLDGLFFGLFFPFPLRQAFFFFFSQSLSTSTAGLPSFLGKKESSSSHPLTYPPILSYPILSYPILSYLILSYPILCHPILSYAILSYPEQSAASATEGPVRSLIQDLFTDDYYTHRNKNEESSESIQRLPNSRTCAPK